MPKVESEQTTTLPSEEGTGPLETPEVASPQPMERPLWLPEKFKTIEDFVKSHTELESTLGRQGQELGQYRKSFGDLYEAGMIDQYGRPTTPQRPPAPTAESEEEFDWERPQASLAKREEKLLERFSKLLDDRLTPFVASVGDNTAEGVLQRVKQEIGDIPPEVEQMARQLINQLSPQQRVVPQMVEGMFDMAYGAFSRRHKAEPATGRPGAGSERRVLGTFNLSEGRDSGAVGGGSENLIGAQEREIAARFGMSEKEWLEERQRFERSKEEANRPDRI